MRQKHLPALGLAVVAAAGWVFMNAVTVPAQEVDAEKKAEAETKVDAKVEKKGKAETKSEAEGKAKAEKKKKANAGTKAETKAKAEKKTKAETNKKKGETNKGSQAESKSKSSAKGKLETDKKARVPKKPTRDQARPEASERRPQRPQRSQPRRPGQAGRVQAQGIQGMQLGKSEQGNWTVVSVQPGSPAARTGLHENDMIMSVDGQALRAPRDLNRILRRQQGQEVEFVVVRNDEEQTLHLRPRALQRPRQARQPFPPRDRFRQQPLPRRQAAQGNRGREREGAIGVRLGDSPRGVFISTIFEGSPAHFSELRLGDEIVTVDGEEFETPQEYADAITGTSGEDVRLEIARNGRIRQLSVPLAPWREAFAGRPMTMRRGRYARSQSRGTFQAMRPERPEREPSMQGRASLQQQINRLQQEVDVLQREIRRMERALPQPEGARRRGAPPRTFREEGEELPPTPDQPQQPGQAPPQPEGR